MSDHPIAYFCAEYGLRADLPIYAGGLGVLAGDTLKAAADLGLPVVGVGLLYRGEEAKQVITADGEQIETDIPVDPLSIGLQHVDVDEQPLFIKVHLTEISVWLHAWKLQIGETVTLYLLDSETEQNHLNERNLTHALYCGTEEFQFKQQLLLGIGGVKLLHSLNIHPRIYHVNEGRPAFLHWQLIRSYMDNHGMGYDEAKIEATKKTVYTNHTLVTAGNPGYPAGLVKTYGQYYADKMGVEIEALMVDDNDEDADRFDITRFALNVSHKANGVSAKHSQLSKQQWPNHDWYNVTNGVHMPTWQRPLFQALSKQEREVADQELWQEHMNAKQDLVNFVKARSGYGFDPNRLVISWARRLAGYKQVQAIFEDLKRLEAILKNSERPVQLLMAGKAHFSDTHGKAILKQVISYFKNELSGHALFIPNYDLDVARHLVQGSDVWLNTPEMDKEASGTSGMKAMANGVLNCSVRDGWVPEVDWFGKGWIIDHTRLSESIYELVEQEIAPLYYDRPSREMPEKWIQMMRENIKEAPRFSAQRMVEQYRDQLYS